MKTTIGRFLECAIENGFIKPSQVVVYTDKYNNIKWIGKAEFAPLFLDWCALALYRFVGNELQVIEKR